QPGDVKYKDQNNDGVINADDQIYIGEGRPTVVGGLDIRLTYKRLTFFVMGAAQSGSQQFYTNNYYWVYGDRKYSEVTRNRWTPETAATATYPRLTTQTNSNNFQSSTFWLHDVSGVSVRRLQVNFDTPQSFASRLFTQRLSFYLRADNVANFSR